MEVMSPGWSLVALEIVFLVALGLWVFSILPITKSRFREGSDKNTRLLLVILVPVPGMLLY